MGVTVITDSGSDFTREEAARLGIEVVPLNILFGGKHYRDGIEIDRATFFRRMDAGEIPSTEPATIDDFKALFAKAVNAGNDVVSVSLSSQISKTFENAKTASLEFPGRVFVIDSHGAGGAESLLAQLALEKAKAGMGAAEIAKAIDPSSRKYGVYFAVHDLNTLGRSGRLPKAVVGLGSMLNVSLVLKMNESGAITPAGQSFSFDKTCEIMVDAVVRSIDRSPQARIAISHVEAPQEAAKLMKLVEERIGNPPAQELVRDAPLTIAAHMGRGAIGIFAIVP